MKIIAKKNKETQNNALFYFLLTAGLTVALLVISIICWIKLGWRWTDIFSIVLLLACGAWAVWEGIKFFALQRVSENIITYHAGKLNFSEEIVCDPKEISALAYVISEDSKTGTWGELNFRVGEDRFVCPCVDNVKIAYARLVKLGATPLDTYAQDLEEMAKMSETEEVEEAMETVEEAETTEETAEVVEAVEETVATEETTEETEEETEKQ